MPRVERSVVPLVALGGAIGAGARAVLADLLPTRPGGLPTGTLVANLVGCLLLGLLLGRRPGPRRQALLGTGVLGGFTTFSALALEVDGLLARAPVLALGYLAVSVAGGVALVGVGARLRRPR